MEIPAPRYRVPDDVAWVDGTEIGLGEELYLTRLPSGETIQLTGTGRIIWHSAIETADPVAEVAIVVSKDRPVIEAWVVDFMAAMRTDGWLQQSIGETSK